MKKIKYNTLITTVFIFLTLSSCTELNTSKFNPKDIYGEENKEAYSSLDKNLVKFYLQENVSDTIKTKQGEDLFLIFTNFQENDVSSIKVKFLDGDLNNDSQNLVKYNTLSKENKKPNLYTVGLTPDQYKEQLKKIKKPNKSKNQMNSSILNSQKIGDKKTFSTFSDGDIDFTLRKENIVMTKFGQKKVRLWTGKSSIILKDCLVKTFTDKFLTDGYNNDIYDHVTNIFGNEWKGDKFDNTIDILAYDIDGDAYGSAGNSIKIGYFAPQTSLDENGILSFFVDIPIMTKEPLSVFSTLSHEFQHMINYTRKIQNSDYSITPTWLNEGFSMSTEDVLASKLSSPTPALLRKAEYLSHTNFSHTPWAINSNETLYSYSSNYFLFAYLMRNFGGVNFLKSYSDRSFVTINPFIALNETLKSLNFENETYISVLRKWGVSTLLSFKEYINPITLKYTSRHDTLESVNYSLESINLKKDMKIENNLLWQANTIKYAKNITHNANNYFYLGTSKADNSEISFEIENPEYVKVTLVKVKDFY